MVMTETVSQIGTILALLAGIGALLWRAGRRGAAEERKRRAEQDRANAEATRERMDDAESNLGNDPAHLREWLRQRGGE